jgi:hypothetical protein
MNNLLATPIGIDETIQSIQVDLYNQLALVWNGDIEGYGRVEKNPENVGTEIPSYYQTSKIVIPEWYNSLKKDYEEVYYNDNKSCVFCFLTADTDDTTDSIVYNSKVKVVFMVDLSKIYPSDTERLTSKAHRDAVEILRNWSFNKFEVKGIERRIEIIFREYTTDKIKFNDMHPLHCFAVKIDLQYYLTDKCI